jgi:hypothetical protein
MSMDTEAKVSIPLKAKAEAGEIHELLLRKMFSNFIKLVNNGYEVSELEGKYKPSWEYGEPTSKRHEDWLNEARANNLHHYHVGFVDYNKGSGNDKDYPGRESDGIIHMTTTCLDNTLTYIVFRTDKKHPKPFSFEYDPTNDFQVAG